MSDQLIAYVNGAFVPLESATVHIEDRGFQFADGVYEVVACFNGFFLDLDAHLQRLYRSCHEIGIELPLSNTELENYVREIYQKNPFRNAMIYIQITRGASARSHLPQDNLVPTVIMTSRQLPMPSSEAVAHGTKAITLPDIRWKRCDIKSIALLASVLGKQEASRRGASETIWLDEEGHALEGCSTNIFAVINGILTTHPLDHQVLGGITRSMALRAAKACQVPFEERPWSLNEVNISECMMSSTTNAVMPITQVDDQPINDGKPGPIALQLRAWMLEEMERLQHDSH